MLNGTQQPSKPQEVLDLTLSDSDDDNVALAPCPPSRPADAVFAPGRDAGSSFTPRRASPPQRSPAQTPRGDQPPPSPPEPRLRPAGPKHESLGPVEAAERLVTTQESPVNNRHLPSPRPSPSPQPAPAPIQPPPDAQIGQRSRRILPPEQRLRIKAHKCRIPAPPPPLPLTANIAIPLLLDRHPLIPLIRPYTRHRHHSSRGASPAESRTSTPIQPLVEAGPSSRPQPSHIGLVDSSDSYWAEIWPAVADMPHLEGSDVESDGNERVFRPDRNPEHLDVLSLPSLLPGRPLAPAQFVPWALDANNRDRPGTLPDPYRRDDMVREEKRREQARREEFERRADESRRREKGKGRAADSDDGMASPPPRKKPRRSRRNETEAELQARLRRRLDIDEATDSEDEAAAASRPTIGFETLARAVLDQQRAKRKMRRAMGQDPDESTDEEP